MRTVLGTPNEADKKNNGRRTDPQNQVRSRTQRDETAGPGWLKHLEWNVPSQCGLGMSMSNTDA
eukprot:1103287-Pyramimonas_sp.AAC.1